jgi:uncharacterized protein (DUF302 family)
MNNPLIAQPSPYSVKKTADRLEAVLQSERIKLFARIDHGNAAKESGLSLADEEVLIFGDPKVGTYLMQECPPLGIELPLRMVIWRAEHTMIAYRDPKTLLADYEIVQNIGIIEKMSALMAALVNETVSEPRK